MIAMSMISVATAVIPEELLDHVATVQRGIAITNLVPNKNRFLASHSTPSSATAEGEDTSPVAVKTSCVTGQGTTIPSMEEGGIDLVIPADGYCLMSGLESMKLTCTGVKMEMQQDKTSSDCNGLTVNSTKYDMTDLGWVCVEGEVRGVKMSMHEKEDCSDASMTLIIAADSCLGGNIGVECGTALEGSNEVTWKEYPANTGAATAGCKAGTEIGSHKFTGVDKCHLTETSSASSVALTFGVAFAGVMVTLALF